MQIPVIKTELASALTALGKLVSRTSLIRAYQGIEIEGKANMLYFKTRNMAEDIEYRLCTDLKEDFPATLVDFEQFRQAVRSCKNKMLKVEIDNGEVFINGVKLAPVNGRFPVPEIIPDQDVCVTELPADTLSALTAVAPMAEKETGSPKKAINGINISGDGFTATNGKELSNIPIQLETIGSVTIPFPLALLATKAFDESGRLTTWQKDEDTLFELSLGCWTWRTKAIKENYPNWKRVVPERTEATHFACVQPDVSGQFQRYLRSVPDDKERNNGIRLSRLPEYPNYLHLESSNGMQFNILAEFDPAWDDLSFTIRREFLEHLLNGGHTRIELNDSYGPIVGTGGTGQYVAMPILTKHAHIQNTQTAEQIASSPPNAQPSVQQEQPVTESTDSVSVQKPTHPREIEPQTTITNTTSNKENPTMNETPTITRTVSAPVQTSVQNREPEKELNPLDELLANIEDMKAKSKALFDDSAAMARKVREVALAQRQKEREYQQTRRTIERIRTASGF